MLNIFVKVLLIMAVLAAFAVPGFALKKLKMIGEGGTLTLSNLLLYVAFFRQKTGNTSNLLKNPCC